MPFNNTNYLPINSDWNEVAGVYGITDTHRGMIYIGETENLKRRMAEHAADRYHPMHRYAPALLIWEGIIPMLARQQRERVLIAEYDPPANRL